MSSHQDVADLNIFNEINVGKDLFKDEIISKTYSEAELIAKKVINHGQMPFQWDRVLDNILTSGLFGYPIMILLLVVVLWITITGANYPSAFLAAVLFSIQEWLSSLSLWQLLPDWIHGFLVLGVFRCVAWVVSVMLPPMAIFFPLFTIMEDMGYLPRVAFNLDNIFRKAGAHGKQALTMCMGFGCNAAGVISCRIIGSPRERLIAILTNNFVPCNGRFPLLIILSTIFIGSAVPHSHHFVAALALTGIILTGITVTLVVSYILSKTLLKGMPSFFALELPPYRKPLVGRIIIRSIFDRTIFVLGRALLVASPVGGIIWVLANSYIGEANLLTIAATYLDPAGRIIGMDGIILMAFILALPANEIVLPLIIMGYTSMGIMTHIGSITELATLLVEDQGWTWITAVSVMLFSLLHYPCGTTLITINKETHSIKWTIMAFLIPLSIALAVCFLFTQLASWL
ncbi:MAG: nucleoside recognition domain-containing protein [Syntrophomonadaceae bacterium]|jgi:ferrous iron transport protein B